MRLLIQLSHMKQLTIFVTCSNEMSRMSKKRRRCINLSNGVTFLEISHTQPKLLDAEHA